MWNFKVVVRRVCSSLIIFFFVMFANIYFALSYFVSSLLAIHPNGLLMILLLVEMEDLMKVGARLSFVAAYFSINFAFLTICQFGYCLDLRFQSRFRFCRVNAVRLANVFNLWSDRF